VRFVSEHAAVQYAFTVVWVWCGWEKTTRTRGVWRDKGEDRGYRSMTHLVREWVRVVLSVRNVRESGVDTSFVTRKGSARVSRNRGIRTKDMSSLNANEWVNRFEA
jgi:hypothetical protein